MQKKAPKSKQPSKPIKKSPVKGRQGIILPLILLAVFTLICYSNAFRSDFTNWDDPAYVVNNLNLQSLSIDNLRIIFSSFSMGNYHPLSILSLAIDYHFFKLDPHGYHLTSIVIHIINVLLVFLVIRKLTGKTLVGFITALLFGIHPMHVESVAWVAERKDVLYFFFYFIALWTYLQYVRTTKNKALFYFVTMLMFVCSLLSKAQAVTLPLIMLLFDYFTSRDINRKVILEKIPFFLLSIGAGVLAVIAQKQSGAITDIPIFPLLDRVLFASYSFLVYLVKLILPVNLSAYYPYPTKVNDSYPMIYYAAPVVAIGITTLAARLYKKNKAVFFGFFFYAINIFLLLQLLPVGGSMMSERYTYLCYVGIFFIVGQLFHDSWNSVNKKLAGYKYLFVAFLAAYTIYSGYRTLERNKVWKNSEVLWTDVIKQFKNVVIAYNNRGSHYQKEGKLEPALADFNEALRLKPDHAETLINRSDVYRVNGKFAESIADCNKVISKGFNSGAYMNRGIAYCMVSRFDEAFDDFVMVIANDPDNSNVYCNRGNLYDMRGKLDSAIADYTMAITLKPDYGDAYYNRGKTKMRLGNYDDAIFDLTNAIQYKTKNTDVYFFRSKAYSAKKDYQSAMQDINTALQNGVNVDPAYVSELRALMGQ